MEEKVVKRNIKRPSRKKVCNFCVDKVVEIDYKDVNKLKKFITEKGKIVPRRIPGHPGRVHPDAPGQGEHHPPVHG